MNNIKIVAMCLAWVMVPMFCNGGELTDEDRGLLEAILAAHATVVDAAGSGEMVVESKERSADALHSLKATVVWDGDHIRYEYRLEIKLSDKPVSVREGILIDTPKLLVNFQKSHRKAFRSIDRVKTYDRVFWVTPSRSWFSYNLEFPLREIFTADESWNYGKREVSLERSDNTITLVIDSPATRGEFRTVFSTQDGGMIQSVQHTGNSGPRYRADYEWAQTDGVWYPKNLRMFSILGGNFSSEPRFEMRISKFRPLIDVPASVFSEQSLGIDDRVEVVTYRKGAAPTVRKAKPLSDDEQLKNLGEMLSGSGFAADEP